MDSVNFEVSSLIYKQILEKKTEEERMLIISMYLAKLINKNSAFEVGLKNTLDVFKKLDNEQG